MDFNKSIYSMNSLKKAFQHQKHENEIGHSNWVYIWFPYFQLNKVGGEGHRELTNNQQKKVETIV